jgi:hypothetical protein
MHFKYDRAFEVYQKFYETGQLITRRFLLDLKKSLIQHPDLIDLIECAATQFSYQCLTRSLHKMLKREDWAGTRNLLNNAGAISIPQAVLFVICFQKSGDFEGMEMVRERLDHLGVNYDFESIVEWAREEPYDDLAIGDVVELEEDV